MKTKLTPLEELRAEKLRLQTELKDKEYRLKDNMSYITKNFGSLLFSSVMPSSGTGNNGITKSLLNIISPKKNKNSLMEKALFFSPMVWNIARPALIGFITKKFTSMIFGSKKKRKRRK